MIWKTFAYDLKTGMRFSEWEYHDDIIHLIHPEVCFTNKFGKKYNYITRRNKKYVEFKTELVYSKFERKLMKFFKNPIKFFQKKPKYRTFKSRKFNPRSLK